MGDLESEKEIRRGRFLAVISYVSFLGVITLIRKRHNRFAVFHAKQGIVIFGFEVASFVLIKIRILDALLSTCGFWIFMLISLWGIVQVFMGKYGRIVIISDIAEKIDI